MSGMPDGYPARCPFCDATVCSVREEVEHMDVAHPDVVRQRLEAAGIREPSPLARARAEGTSGPSMEQLVDALEENQTVRRLNAAQGFLVEIESDDELVMSYVAGARALIEEAGARAMALDPELRQFNEGEHE